MRSRSAPHFVRGSLVPRNRLPTNNRLTDRLCCKVSKSPSPQFPPGGDLIYLGIEAKRDRFCCEVSEPPQVPNSPISPIPHSL